MVGGRKLNFSFWGEFDALSFRCSLRLENSVSQSGKYKSPRNICFLKHHAISFWSNLCCTKSCHIESRAVPLPGPKPCANSHPLVFYISFLYQLSKIKATNLLFTYLCFLNASGLDSSHCFSLLSLELPSSLGHFLSSETCGIHASFHFISAAL